MTEAFLVGGVRTPVGRYGGALASVRPDDLAALVVREAVRRAGVDPETIDEVILGAANQAGDDNRNVARMAVLLAGLPLTVPGYTVNRLCASGLTAVANAARAIRAGRGGRGGRRRGRVDDARALGAGQAGHALGQAGRELRHRAGLAVRQPPARPGAHDHPRRDGRAGRPARRHHPRGLRRLRPAQPDPGRGRGRRRSPRRRHRRRPHHGAKRDTGVVDADETPRATTAEALAALPPAFVAGRHRHRRHLQPALGRGQRDRGGQR